METKLAPGMTAATSATITVTAAAPVTVALAATEEIPRGVHLDIRLITGEGDGYLPLKVSTLNAGRPWIELRAPGQYHVIRPNIADRGVNVGVVVDGLASDPL